MRIAMAEFAERISKLAHRALLFEVYATPKPGLVDRNNNGAHGDMDIALFEKSANVLTPFFQDFVLAGAEYAQTPKEGLLQRIRPIGIRAEAAMFEVTGGINTHKGIIFSMGILCTALGYQYSNGDSLNIEGIWKLVAAMGYSAVVSDLRNTIVSGEETSGLKQYLRYGVRGIRGEVAAGMPSVGLVALAQFEKHRRHGETLNDAGCKTLLFLLREVDDSNVISRSNLACGQLIKECLRAYLKQAGTISLDCIRQLDDVFIEWNLSPGGCADLLAITYFVYSLRTKEETSVEAFLAETDETMPQELKQQQEEEAMAQLLSDLRRGLTRHWPKSL